MTLHGMARIAAVESRSITAENPTGEPGRGGRAIPPADGHPARELGQGWKVAPAVMIPAGETAELADIAGPGCLTHLWMTAWQQDWRRLVLRIYWEGDPEPAVEVPLGDFFCTGWGEFAQVDAIPVAVNPRGGFNCYWEMPFRRRARITLANAGPGHYAGTYLAWGSNSSGWWGEGEVKFYLDGDDEFPTICGTGTEDYFGGAWGFKVDGAYATFSTPYLGMPQVLADRHRFGLYRFHLPDPIRFRSELRADVQALGWRAGGRYRQLHDDIASTAYFYSTATSTGRPVPPELDAMEIG